MFSTTKDTLPSAAESIAAALKSIHLSGINEAFDEEEHQKWLENATKVPIAVDVSEPESRGSYLTKYITYLVRQEPQNYKVRRRYSDFEWLHHVLASRYVGMVLPPMPEKNVYKTEAFNRSRMHGLNWFLQQVVNNGYLRSDEAVFAFLSIQDDKEWESAKKKTMVLENAGAGHLRWMKALHSHDVPENADRIILDVKAQLEPLEKHLLAVAASAKRLAEKSQAVAKEMQELNKEFHSWYSFEVDCEDATKVEHVVHDQAPQSSCKAIMHETKDVVSAWTELTQFHPAIHEYLLYENLRQLAHYLRDLRELFKSRDAYVATYNRTISALQIHEAERHTCENKGLASKVAKIQAQIDEERSLSHRSKFMMDYIYRAIFYSEMGRFKSIRSSLVHTCVGQVAAAEYQYAKKMSSLWQQHLKACENPAALLQEAKQTLERTSSEACLPHAG